MTESIKRVLVVLRHRKKGKEIGVALERSAFSVDVVHKGIEALKVLQRSCPYDLVITELLLDEISGFALVIAARKYPDVATIGLNNGGASLMDHPV
jgi:PleD family two-component response regulator